MKRSASILFFAFVLTASLSAAYLQNEPQTKKQPDGTIVHCYATGDEFYHWLHDARGFTIIQNPETGYWVYADLHEDCLTPTQLLPNVHDPAVYGLRPGLNISKAKASELAKTRFQTPNLKGFTGTTTTGTLNNLVIFIRFNDQSEYTTSLSIYQNALNGTGQVSQLEYFKDVSNNQLTITSHFFPEAGSTVVSYQSSQARSYFQPYNATTNTNGYSTDSELAEREHTLLKNATESVAAQVVATGLDIDQDNNGYVDNVVFIVQGGTDGWSDLLWPHKWALYSYDVRIGGARVYTYNFQLSNSVGVSVLCHEMFHSLGAPDLYRYENNDIKPVGPWDIMANNRTPPQHMSAYMKMRYGQWFSSIPEITSEGTYSLTPLSVDPFAAYKISSPNSSEYFVVEYRKAEGLFESSLVGSGLIIYRINPSLGGNSNGPPDEVYVYRPNGTNATDGDINSANYSSNVGRTEISDGTNPSSFLSDGSPGGLHITNIGSAGSSLSFEVSFTTTSFNPPQNLSAVAGVDYVDLSWEAPEDGGANLLAFRVFRNGTEISVINDAASRSYHDPNLQVGSYNYYLTALYAGPSGESGASNQVQIQIQEYLPDLVSENLSVNPSLINAGQSVSFTGRIKNQGTAASDSGLAKVFLSANSSLDTNDTELSTIAFSSLESTVYESFDLNLEIPDDLQTGGYYLLLAIDPEHLIDESNETNNLGNVSLDIRASYPDLLITQIRLNPDQLEAGGELFYTAKVLNAGNRAASSSELKISVSVDRSLDPSDLWIESFAIPAINAGGSFDISGSLILSEDIESGEYFLVLFADGSDAIAESDETNNEDYAGFAVLIQEDILLKALQLDKTLVKDGGTLAVSFQVENAGLETSLPFSVQVLLEESNVVSGQGLVLIELDANPLLAGETASFNQQITIPSGTLESSYYLLVYADPLQFEQDSKPENNFNFRLINIENEIDLIPHIQISKEEFKVGENLLLEIELENIETKNASESEIGIFLSSDEVLDLEDLKLGVLDAGRVLGKSTNSYEFHYSLTESLNPGSYYLVVLADLNNLLAELDEQNNEAKTAFRILDTSWDTKSELFENAVMYPNPARDKLFFKSYKSLENKLQISLYSIQGQQISIHSITLDASGNAQLDVSQLSEGMYFVELYQGLKKEIMRLIITR